MLSEIIIPEEIEAPALPFPKLMVGDITNTIVLFIDGGEGTVVGGSRYKIGYYSDEWDICNFKDLELGTKIVLQN